MKIEAANEFVAIATYYNPCRYVTRRRNYDTFIEGLRRQGIRCITIECAFGSSDFELPIAPDVIHIRARDVLWQKERLINLVTTSLPRKCKYLAILDCDIVFDNEDWASDLIRVMQTSPIAQVFETCLWLDEGGINEAPLQTFESFSSVMNKLPAQLRGETYSAHGHTGLGWAMHRDIFDRVGLYEAAICGGADHILAHACFNDFGNCFPYLNANKRHMEHVKAWGRRLYPFIRGNVGVVPGCLRHLWHGDYDARQYQARQYDIIALGFDPWTDLEIASGLPIQWAEGLGKPELKEYVASYFEMRKEDGLPLSSRA